MTLLANWKAKVTAKAAVNQKCLKHSILLLGNLTHLLHFPQDEGHLAHILLKARTPDTQIHLTPTCYIGHWLPSLNPSPCRQLKGEVYPMPGAWEDVKGLKAFPKLFHMLFLGVWQIKALHGQSPGKPRLLYPILESSTKCL